MTDRPRLLDLFCGAGGAAMGYHRAGFDVVGVDLHPQPNYPFEFYQADAMAVLNWLNGGGAFAERYYLSNFSALHASPPCQRYSDLAHRNGNAEDWPDLVEPVRDAFRLASWMKDRPWVIENVEGAPLLEPVVLCGTMFPGLRVLRHRLFESNVELIAPPHGDHPLVFTYDKRKAHYGKLDQDAAFVQVTGGGNCTVANARAAMGIEWMTKDELNEAIPPAYAEHLGQQLIDAVTGER